MPMITAIKQWFALPVFEGDEEKIFRASVINAIPTVFTFNSSLTAFAMLRAR
jgi:hypothetical protein